MTGFTKLWSEILTSSIWNEDDKTRIVWITLLAAMGPGGIVRASVGGLAHQARVSREDCEKALNVLKSPDPDSRSKEHEGRRIEEVEGGFVILNAGKYREVRSHDERKVYMAEYMKEYRKERKLCVNNRKQNVNSVNIGKQPLAEAEAEAPVPGPWAVEFGLELPEALRTEACLAAVKKWMSYKAERREKYKPLGLQATLTKWSREFSAAEFPEAVEHSMAAGWKGVFANGKQHQQTNGNGAQRHHRNDNMHEAPGLAERLEAKSRESRLLIESLASGTGEFKLPKPGAGPG